MPALKPWPATSFIAAALAVLSFVPSFARASGDWLVMPAEPMLAATIVSFLWLSASLPALALGFNLRAAWSGAARERGRRWNRAAVVCAVASSYWVLLITLFFW